VARPRRSPCRGDGVRDVLRHRPSGRYVVGGHADAMHYRVAVDDLLRGLQVVPVRRLGLVLDCDAAREDRLPAVLGALGTPPGEVRVVACRLQAVPGALAMGLLCPERSVRTTSDSLKSSAS
jgi:hypothetical protein